MSVIKVTILCSSQRHPIFSFLQQWMEKRSNIHTVELLTDINKISGGDFLFLISFDKLVRSEIRSRYKHTLVIHASDLPSGKGWSPHIWQILDGKNKITVTLFEAADELDAGDIWKKHHLILEGHELFDEINAKLFAIELELMDFALENFNKIKPIQQKISDDISYPKRTPEDSKLDPDKSIAEQFELMRVADTERFPCFFHFRGHRYKLILRKY